MAAALRARHRSLRLPDALVLATAEVLGAAKVLTADRARTKISRKVRLI
jgi:predicted nucleic acid-binding protein